jgi:hypothetical protein
MDKEIEAIVEDLRRDIRDNWSEDNQNAFYLMGIKNNGSMIGLHDTLGRQIRNKYSLWQIPWIPDLRDGIDYSPYHPDQLSDTILKEVWNRGLLQPKENK